jgi:hypothetical protein
MKFSGVLQPGLPGEPESLVGGKRPFSALAYRSEEAFYADEMAGVHGWGPSLGIAAASFVVGAGAVGLVAWKAGRPAAAEEESKGDPENEEATEDCPDGN